MKRYKDWEIVDEMPPGYRVSVAGSPLGGHVFIIDKSPLRGGRMKLLRIATAPQEEVVCATVNDPVSSVDGTSKEVAVEYAFPSRSVNELARNKFKERILKDILFDLAVCDIEGWDKMEYINEIKCLINGISTKPISA